VRERVVPVLVVDEDDNFRERVASVVARAGFETLEASSGAAALELAVSRLAAVVLAVTLPDADGFSVFQQLRDVFGDGLPVIFVGPDPIDPHDRLAGLLMGADDYLPKSTSPDELLARLRRLIGRTDAARAVIADGRGLSVRELEVLRLLAAGSDATEIAKQLVISKKTVASHLQRVMAKLGVHNRSQAVAEAYRRGLVSV
jgi:DNA-binding NarL/FixJ family response regulator